VENNKKNGTPIASARVNNVQQVDPALGGQKTVGLFVRRSSLQRLPLLPASLHACA
jgi:hypothetical protein